MKKGIFITLLAVIICQGCMSKEKDETTVVKKDKNSVEQLFKEFAKEEGIEHVKVGGIMMLFARAFADTKGVSGVDVYSFDECDSNIKERINDAIKTLKDESYETLLSTNEDGERTKILVKITDDFIHELVVVTGGDEPALVRIKGKIKPEDVQNVINDNK